MATQPLQPLGNQLLEPPTIENQLINHQHLYHNHYITTTNSGNLTFATTNIEKLSNQLQTLATQLINQSTINIIKPTIATN